MPRIARVIYPKYPHHITQRGNYKQKIFIDDQDRKKYLSLIKEESIRYKVKILAYCLMDNHVHFIGIPQEEESLGNLFKYVNMKYSQYFNRKLGSGGHLFQGRFFSCVMDEQHIIMCAKYIERNPVRAKMVKNAWEWEWSSAAEHCGLQGVSYLEVDGLFEYIDEDTCQWKGLLSEEDNKNEIEDLCINTQRGRVFGNVDFIKKIERKLGRELVLKPSGRPKVKK